MLVQPEQIPNSQDELSTIVATGSKLQAYSIRHPAHVSYSQLPSYACEVDVPHQIDIHPLKTWHQWDDTENPHLQKGN